jgi:leucyl/phenylalanyl-tRNA--protein transferase
MPVYQLIDLPIFPPPEEADESGLVAVGGDLSVPRLLAAYSQGIFPWYSEDQPILWWNPDPRLILEPGELKISRSLGKVLRKGLFEIRVDTAFPEVIRACAALRAGLEDDGTWITPAVETAYTRLHRLGYAHSIESWLEGQLVGGLYGVSLGRCFFGESMFSRRTDASKVALVALVDLLKSLGIDLIDCQVRTEHLISLGAKEIPRAEFLQRLKAGMRAPTLRRAWTWPPSPTP